MNATANPDISTETKSIGSTRSRGSAVLARAREYNRIIDENRSRSKSRDGNRSHGRNHIPSPPRDLNSTTNANSNSNSRSVSVSVSQMNQRERAMASVQAEPVQTNGGYNRRVDSRKDRTGSGAGRGDAISSSHHNFEQSSTFHQQQQQQQQPQYHQQQQYRSSPTPSQKSAARVKERGISKSAIRSSPQSQPQSNPVTNKENNYRDRDVQQQSTSTGRLNGASHHSHRDSNSNSNTQNQMQMQMQRHSRNNGHHEQQAQSQQQQQQQQPQQPNQAIVTPELLVDALSGHEDGLLAIAERLMEHYDSGYDAMGEAIIDAFADVQKLFQHVVEAAHMEGAAYEAGRREEEIERLKRALGGEGGGGAGAGGAGLDYSMEYQKSGDTMPQNTTTASSSPLRHEEFVDQDVRDVLVEAIRKGQPLKDSSKFAECYQLYEHSCNSASALLPVDSDHRGRLQLSIARAESMNAERACAILKYVMDDVLRSGLTSNSKVVMPDPSQRGDCVLSRPPPKSRIMDDSSLNSKYNGTAVAGGDGVVLQSSEEALASMVEEMKEILAAPVYDNSPLRSVAERFWTALNEAQRNNIKTEEKLEQKLGELKGDFLLAKMEWEEKYNTLSRDFENQKRKAERLKNARYMDQARQGVSSIARDSDNEKYLDNESSQNGTSNYDSPRSGRPSSVASFASLSHHAKSIASTFSCTGEREFAEQKRSGSRIHPRRNMDRSPPPATTAHRSPRYNSRR